MGEINLERVCFAKSLTLFELFHVELFKDGGLTDYPGGSSGVSTHCKSQSSSLAAMMITKGQHHKVIQSGGRQLEALGGGGGTVAVTEILYFMPYNKSRPSTRV